MSLKTAVEKIVKEMKERANRHDAENYTREVGEDLRNFALRLEAACDAVDECAGDGGEAFDQMLTARLHKADQTRKSVERQKLDERLELRANAEEGLSPQQVLFVGGPDGDVWGPGIPAHVPRVVGQTRTQVNGCWYVLGDDGAMHFENRD